MKLSYRHKLTVSFLVIFALFAAGILFFEQYRARNYKTDALTEKLDAYSGIVYQYIKKHPGDPGHSMDTLLTVLPAHIRLTLVAENGKVIYDNLFNNPEELEDHSGREEIIQARKEGSGSYIRTSASNSQAYLYYARYFGNVFVRVALPYDIQVRSLLRPDNGFLYFMLLLFVIAFFFVYYAGGRFGNSIRKMRDFSRSVNLDPEHLVIPVFPKDELGEIGEQIVNDYKKLKDNKSRLTMERDKLFQHIYSSAEGVCFFNPDHSVAFYNGLFLQYLNILTDRFSKNPDNVLGEDFFHSVRQFIHNNNSENYFETKISGQGKEFFVRVNIFDDKSYEVVLNDVTMQEKTQRLKREMTGNIAHELRTPVTSIRGFLETLLSVSMDEKKQKDFLKKAYNQSIVLSELIRDMGLLTKIDDMPDAFELKPVNVASVLDRVETELKEELESAGIEIKRSLSQELLVKGNENLIYSIFRNLTDNVIRYAGKGVQILINELEINDGRVFISFADTGKGIKDEKQLNRIFERFYRVDDGRTRDSGGSGLGLSIVKNAVLFHKGTISVKNRKTGGLEFIFTLNIA